ncbi:hypothetical protein OK016_06990 [Vibrio chagasii]|nr:hypothetical protein [Vibrio chagasii]
MAKAVRSLVNSEAFGVQDLQLDTAGSGDDSQVTVSGYIYSFTELSMALVSSILAVSLPEQIYRLMQDLYVEAVSGLDSAVDLLYQFDSSRTV